MHGALSVDRPAEAEVSKAWFTETELAPTLTSSLFCAQKPRRGQVFCLAERYTGAENRGDSAHSSAQAARH